MLLALRRVRRGLAAIAMLALPAAAQAPEDFRVALVIGNASYPTPATLANPVNDASAMAEALRRLGFQVTMVRDGNRAEMRQAITRVRDLLRGHGGVGIFYYAGHGLQLDWRNYMLPVDARPHSAGEVQAQAVPVDDVITAFKDAGNRMNILILDACRDNPFSETATGKGLAQVDAPPGTFLAYATAPGNVAEDGRGSNGLYTGFLLQELARPSARIEDVFKRVRLQVRAAAPAARSRGRAPAWRTTSSSTTGRRACSRPGARPPPSATKRSRARRPTGTASRTRATPTTSMRSCSSTPPGRSARPRRNG